MSFEWTGCVPQPQWASAKYEKICATYDNHACGVYDKYDEHRERCKFVRMPVCVPLPEFQQRENVKEYEKICATYDKHECGVAIGSHVCTNATWPG